MSKLADKITDIEIEYECEECGHDSEHPIMGPDADGILDELGIRIQMEQGEWRSRQEFAALMDLLVHNPGALAGFGLDDLFDVWMGNNHVYESSEDYGGVARVALAKGLKGTNRYADQARNPSGYPVSSGGLWQMNPNRQPLTRQQQATMMAPLKSVKINPNQLVI